MGFLSYVSDLLANRGPLTRADAELWAAASNLPDLCELTALWLEGRIDSQPGYHGPVDVDEHDAPGLTATLIALNRAGYLTNGSQAGFDGLGYDGAHWTQLAAVDGFTDRDTCRSLCSLIAGTRFQAVVWSHRTSIWSRNGEGVVVTRREGQPRTDFGGQLHIDTVQEIYDGCGDEALAALRDTVRLAIYDPTPGPNDLWPTLLAGRAR